MGVVSYLGDGLKNLVANLGTGRDKASSSYYAAPTLNEHDLVNAYRGAWLPKKIVNIPALDACRNWRGWQGEAEQITAIEAVEKRLGVKRKVLDAMTRARLFGGAGIYIGTGDPDPSLPLDPARVGRDGVRYLNVMSKRSLQAGPIDLDPQSPYYGQPAYYTMTGNAASVEIHPSRLVRFVGEEHPDPETASGQQAGWGDSVLLSIYNEVRNADSTSGNIASLVFEAKVDVIKIPGLMAKLADSQFEGQLLNRLQLAATAKGINGTLILDAEEEYDQKSASFSELTNILLAFMQLVSGAADIPITRLLGQSPGGLNASGDNDIRNYYDRIRSNQELVIEPALAILDECLIRSALGGRPEEVYYNWRSLWQTTDKERADIGKTVADTVKTLADTRLFPDDVLTVVATNMMTESGVAPGLESEMERWIGGEGDEPVARTGEPVEEQNNVDS